LDAFLKTAPTSSELSTDYFGLCWTENNKKASIYAGFIEFIGLTRMELEDEMVEAASTEQFYIGGFHSHFLNYRF
jgi:hypothetical protein